jgi:hypothetical protein
MKKESRVPIEESLHAVPSSHVFSGAILSQVPPATSLVTLVRAAQGMTGMGRYLRSTRVLKIHVSWQFEPYPLVI